MRNSHSLTCLATLVIALGMSASWAAEPAEKEMPPPKLQKLEEGDAPITIRPPSTGTQIIERRGSGNELKEVEVKSGKSTYTLRPRRGTGKTPADDIVIPEWKVKEFGKPPADEKNAPQQLAPAPPRNGDK